MSKINSIDNTRDAISTICEDLEMLYMEIAGDMRIEEENGTTSRLIDMANIEEYLDATIRQLMQCDVTLGHALDSATYVY